MVAKAEHACLNGERSVSQVFSPSDDTPFIATCVNIRSGGYPLCVLPGAEIFCNHISGPPIAWRLKQPVRSGPNERSLTNLFEPALLLGGTDRNHPITLSQASIPPVAGYDVAGC